MKHSANQEFESRNREFVRLLGTHEQQLAEYVHALIPLWQDAEDVLQNTRLCLWEQFDSFQTGTNFAAWAFTIARYAVRTHRTNSQRQRVCFSDDVLEKISRHLPTISASTPNTRLSALIECVKKLSKANRKLLSLVYASQQKIKCIARELGQTSSAVYVALFRVRHSLYECVEKRLQKEEDR
jgi:RNA polymerase sigma-70 factor (ECF subfamily)